MIAVEEIQHETREAWLETRKAMIGGSDAPQVVGVRPSKFATWAEKSGLLHGERDVGEAAEWGIRLEPVIAAAAADRYGRKVEPSKPFTITRRKDKPHIGCSLDAKIWMPEREDPGVLQIKATGSYKRKEWDPAPPLPFQVQLQHEMLASGLKWGCLVVLVGGNRLLGPFDSEVNQTFAEKLEADLDEFWEMVTKGVPPELDDSEAALDAVSRMYLEGDLSSVVLDGKFCAIDDELQSLKETHKEREKRIELLKAEVKLAMGPAAVGLLPDGRGHYMLRDVAGSTYTVNRKPSRSLFRSK